AILRLPRVERWLSRPGVRMVLRCLLLPALIALLVYALSPTLGRFPALRWAATLGTFIVVSGLLASRVGIWVEDYLTERVAPTWRVLSREWLPSLFHVIGRAFRALMDAVERVI